MIGYSACSRYTLIHLSIFACLISKSQQTSSKLERNGITILGLDGRLSFKSQSPRKLCCRRHRLFVQTVAATRDGHKSKNCRTILDSLKFNPPFFMSISLNLSLKLSQEID